MSSDLMTKLLRIKFWIKKNAYFHIQKSKIVKRIKTYTGNESKCNLCLEENYKC